MAYFEPGVTIPYPGSLQTKFGKLYDHENPIERQYYDKIYQFIKRTYQV